MTNEVQLTTSDTEAAPAAAPQRERVSAFVICYNEEDQIAECLESLKFCDEILCVDSFSTDRTVEICLKQGARVVQRKWTGYRDQKEYGLSLTSHEWVINVDADERVSPELRDNVLNVLQEEYAAAASSGGQERAAGYELNRVVYFLGRWWRRGGWYPEYRLRFFKKSRVKWGGVDPHEKPIVSGKKARLQGELHHFTYDNLEEQMRKLNSFSSIAAREDYRLGRRMLIFKLLFNPLLRVFKFYVFKRGYREGTAGLIVAFTEGYYTFMKYAKLWECQLQDLGKGEEEK